MAAFVLLLASRAVTGNALRRLDGRRRLGLLAAGVVLAAHFAFFVAGLLATSLAAAAALVSLEPLAVVVAAWLSFGDKPTPREQVGLGLAMGGAVLVGSSAGQGEHRLMGDALVLVAVVLFGAYVALARGLRSTMPTTSYAACVYTVAAVSLVPVAMIAGHGAAAAPASAWMGVLALGLVPTLLGHTLLQRAARHVPASIVALTSPGETVGSVLIGVAMGLAPTPTEWAGAALVVTGVVVAVR